MDVRTKACSYCGEIKELSAFHVDSLRPDGRRSACKLCRSLSHSKVERAKLPPPPPPPTDENELKALARQRAIKDVVNSHFREFEIRYNFHIDTMGIQARWHQLN